MLSVAAQALGSPSMTYISFLSPHLWHKSKENPHKKYGKRKMIKGAIMGLVTINFFQRNMAFLEPKVNRDAQLICPFFFRLYYSPWKL